MPVCAAELEAVTELDMVTDCVLDVAGDLDPVPDLEAEVEIDADLDSDFVGIGDGDREPVAKVDPECEDEPETVELWDRVMEDDPDLDPDVLAELDLRDEGDGTECVGALV